MSWFPLQFRSSEDGIVWSPWNPVISPNDKVVPANARYVQGRIYKDKKWTCSRIYTMGEEART